VDRLVRPFAGKPVRRRLYGVVQIGAGIALAATLTARGRRSAEAITDQAPLPKRSVTARPA
jgi:hypothetical protein